MFSDAKNKEMMNGLARLFHLCALGFQTSEGKKLRKSYYHALSGRRTPEEYHQFNYRKEQATALFNYISNQYDNAVTVINRNIGNMFGIFSRRAIIPPDYKNRILSGLQDMTGENKLD